MVQEFVPSSRRLRVYAVGGELVGFELGARLDAGFGGVRHGSVTPVPVPGELDAQLGLLARRWGMDVAAFDLLDTAAGPVFLHVTAACEWLRLERAAGVATVTDAVAGLLEKNFHRAA
jgi:glutathione synthase/RimK-type ligase-like ATP-grasp enzyme